MTSISIAAKASRDRLLGDSARPVAAVASSARAAAMPQVRVVDEPSVCQSLGEGVYELPAMIPRAVCARVVAEVSARVSNGSATDRGTSLKTANVYVRDLADAEDVYRARDSAEFNASRSSPA